MALQEFKVGEDSIWIEVSDQSVAGAAASSEIQMENTSVAKQIQDLPEYIRKTVSIMTSPVRAAFEGAGASEWSMELNIGIKGGVGIPFIANGETDAAIKVVAKWKK